MVFYHCWRVREPSLDISCEFLSSLILEGRLVNTLFSQNVSCYDLQYRGAMRGDWRDRGWRVDAGAVPVWAAIVGLEGWGVS